MKNMNLSQHNHNSMTNMTLSQHNHNSRSSHDKYDCVPVSSDTDTDRRLLTFFLGSDQSSSTPISCLSRLCGTLGQAVVTIISSNIKIVQHYPSGCDVSWSFSRPKYKYIHPCIRHVQSRYWWLAYYYKAIAI